MAIRQRGQKFQVDLTVNQKRAPRISFATKREAERVEALWRVEMLEGRQPTIPNAKRLVDRAGMSTLGDLLDYCERNHWRGMKAKATQVGNATQVCKYLGMETKVADVTHTDLCDFAEARAAQGKKGSTINRNLTALNVMLKVAVKHGIIDKVPERPKEIEYEGRLRWYSDAEETSLLHFFEGRELHWLCMVACDTGFRQGELLKLMARDFSPETGRLHAWQTKGNENRSVPCTKRVKAFIAKRIADRKLAPTDLIFDTISRTEISRQMNRWKKFAGLPAGDEACFHTWRHTCATRLVMRGVPLNVVQKWMGHKDIQTTLRYAHVAPDGLDNALDALEQS